MIIRRKHVCDKTDTPNNDWDVEIVNFDSFCTINAPAPKFSA